MRCRHSASVETDVAAAVRHAAGLAELVSRFGSEITALTQEVHAASSPLAMVTAGMPARGIYGAIRFGFHGTGRIAALGGRLAGDEPAPDSWLDVQSALNGAFGHLFAESGNAFALPMSLHSPRARAARRAPDRLPPRPLHERARLAEAGPRALRRVGAHAARGARRLPPLQHGIAYLGERCAPRRRCSSARRPSGS